VPLLALTSAKEYYHMSNSPPARHGEAPEPRENTNFVQVERSYLKNGRTLTRKSPLASEILMYLIEHMNKRDNAVVCSYQVLTETTGVSRRSVARAIKVLKDDNWIDAVKIGNATAYAVNARAFWRNARNQKRYAIFSATVIASETEQEDIDKPKPQLRYVPILEDGERHSVDADEELPPPDQRDLDLT
jgi:DNA-binding transcriptional ArsR family regulator